MKQPVNRTVCVAIDLSKAFDTVDHHQLLDNIDNLTLNAHIKRFLCSYLRGRQTYVEFRGSKSKHRKMKQGVPQGGVLSPILFNLYMASIPQPQGNIKLVTYADDGTALNSGTDIKKICDELNDYLKELDIWFKNKNLFISPAKSSATIFTTETSQFNMNLPININGFNVPTIKNPKLLGITFDNGLFFNKHTEQIEKSLRNKNNALKALAGSTWGKEKETLVNTWKAIGSSVMNYCSPLWSHMISDTKMQRLQTQQNTALRTALGCIKMSKISHLHTESKVLPVKEHFKLLSKQYLLKTQLDSHPNNIDLHAPRAQNYRQMKNTLKSKYGEEIRNLIPETGLSEELYKQHLKRIHTNEVRTYIASRENNQVLEDKPPEINPTERNLPRSTRSSLSQLRSGYSPLLKSYMARIDPDIQDLCPECNINSHTTWHLFNCPAKPTPLTVLSLWKQPEQAAAFLGLIPVAQDEDIDVD